MTKLINDWSTSAGSNNFAESEGGFPEGMQSSNVNNAARETMAVIKRWFADNNGSLTTAGTQPDYTVASPNQSSIAAYYDGFTIMVDFHAANAGGAATLNVNSLGAVSLVWGDGTAIAANEITADMKGLCVHDGTNFQIIGGGGISAGSLVTTRGDIIYGNSTPAAARLPLGAADTAPVSDGTDLAYTGIVKQGTHSLWVPANSMVSRTTNGAASGTAETSTHKVMLNTLDFDASTNEFAQFTIQMPKSWDAGTITAQFVWSHPATATNFGVRFFIQGVSFADGDALDTAFGTAIGHTADTGGTTDDVYITPVTAAITVAGAGKSEFVSFQIYRDTADGGDNLAVDARLHGVSIFYSIDAADDA